MLRFTLISLFIIVSCLNAAATPLRPFQLDNAPLSEFIEWVSVNSDKSIVTGSGVAGTVTLRIQKLDTEDLIPFLENVLFANGFNLVKEDNLYLILPISNESSDITSEPIPLASKVISLSKIPNEKAKKYIDTLLKSSVSATSQNIASGPKYFITLMPVSNSFLVTAPPESLALLDSFIASIDVRSPQVLIEAVITENDLDNSLSDGVSFATSLVENGFSAVSGLIPSPDSFAAGGLSAIYSKGGDVRSFIEFLNSNSDTNILSTPRLIVRDQERGEITVGQNVPFLISKEVTDGGNSITKIERHDVGISLFIKPRIINQTILLDITQVSSSVSTSSQASDIITNKRKIKTSVTLENEQAILLGGLVSDTKRVSRTGVPFLMNIPFLGRLFSSTRNDVVKTEMNVLIKATLI